MFSPGVFNILLEFAEFWSAMRSRRISGQIHEWMIHRVREEWVRCWLGLPTDRKVRLRDDLAALTDEERASITTLLSDMIESDRDPARSIANGPGAGGWVFMQLAHMDPFDGDPLFARWRLHGATGFKALCITPTERFPIICTLLQRTADEPSHYEYNLNLAHATGVLSTITAITNILEWFNPLLFGDTPRGCAHQPRALRIPLRISLVFGAICVFAVYAAGLTGRLTEMSLTFVVYGACVCSALLVALWSVGTFSDWRTERQLASLLTASQVGWALGDILPSKTTRNVLNVVGESFSAALALSVVSALGTRMNGKSCWTLWCMGRAAENMARLGVTGELSPDGMLLPVGFGAKGEKKALCMRPPMLTLLAPKQPEALPTAQEKTQGLRSIRCRTLKQMICAAAHMQGRLRPGRLVALLLWIAVILAIVLVIFSCFAARLIFPDDPPELVVDQPPIIEDAARSKQHVILHFRTGCPQCFVVRLHSPFWQTPTEKRLAKPDGSDVAVYEVELVRREDARGDTSRNSLDGSVEIIRARALPWLPLPPAPVEEITFGRLNDMYERSEGVGKYAYPNH